MQKSLSHLAPHRIGFSCLMRLCVSAISTKFDEELREFSLLKIRDERRVGIRPWGLIINEANVLEMS